MITATYRTLSTRLREPVNAGETGQENAVYSGQDIDGSCDSGLVHDGPPIAIDFATGKKLTEDVTMARK